MHIQPIMLLIYAKDCVFFTTTLSVSYFTKALFSYFSILKLTFSLVEIGVV